MCNGNRHAARRTSSFMYTPEYLAAVKSGPSAAQTLSTWQSSVVQA
jgi:hypothetical protein